MSCFFLTFLHTIQMSTLTYSNHTFGLMRYLWDKIESIHNYSLVNWYVCVQKTMNECSAEGCARAHALYGCGYLRVRQRCASVRVSRYSLYSWGKSILSGILKYYSSGTVLLRRFAASLRIMWCNFFLLYLIYIIYYYILVDIFSYLTH